MLKKKLVSLFLFLIVGTVSATKTQWPATPLNVTPADLMEAKPQYYPPTVNPMDELGKKSTTQNQTNPQLDPQTNPPSTSGE